jgi:hypothetical protein
MRMFLLLCLTTTVSLAGYNDDNLYLSLHRHPGDAEAVYELRLHRGDQNIDTVSPAFGSAWYSGLSAPRRSEYRSAFIDAC